MADNSYYIYLVHIYFVNLFQDILEIWPGGPVEIKMRDRMGALAGDQLPNKPVDNKENPPLVGVANNGGTVLCRPDSAIDAQARGPVGIPPAPAQRNQFTFRNLCGQAL